jgi:hypothetical protein
VRHVLSGLVDAVRLLVISVVAVSILGGALWLRASATPQPTAATIDGNVNSGTGAAALSPGQLKAAGAAALEAAVLPAGSGYTFEIVQRSTMFAKPDGPRIEIPDPEDRYKTLGLTDEYELGSYIERGRVTPDGFWMEMRTGPGKDAKPDWAAEYQFGALVRAGRTYRNDGDGWYETDRPPGIGLDPRTAALLPALLRNATSAKDAGTTPVNDMTARALTARGAVADIPGIVAVDGEAFTELSTPIALAFDDLGRLVRLQAVARNTTMSDFDLLVDTVITFAYPATAAPLPLPEPAYTRTTPIVTP